MNGQAMLMSIGGSLGLRPRLAFANRVHILSCRQCRTQLLCGSSGVTRQEQCALYLLLVSYHAAVANCVLIFYSTVITTFLWRVLLQHTGALQAPHLTDTVYREPGGLCRPHKALEW